MKWFLNSTAISDSKIPLPLSRDENIILIINNVSLKLVTEEMFHSKSGTLYLTETRLCYVSNAGSVCIPLKRILSYLKIIEFMNYNNEMGFVFLGFERDEELFYWELKCILSTVLVDTNQERDAPYYSELSSE